MNQSVYPRLSNMSGATILALLTGLLYVIGTAYYHGTLKYWGLDNTLFVKTFNETLYLGFTVLANSFYEHIYAVMATIALLSFVLLCLGVIIRKLAVAQKIWQFLCEPSYKPDDESLDKAAGMLQNGLKVITFIVLLWLLTYAISYSSGQRIAATIHNKLISGDYDNDALNLAGQTVYIIDCANNTCAVFRKSKQDIMLISLDKLNGTSKKISTNTAKTDG